MVLLAKECLTRCSRPHSTKTLLLDAYVLQQVQWSGVEARLRHTEGDPGVHELRQQRFQEHRDLKAPANDLPWQPNFQAPVHALRSSLLRGQRFVASTSLPQEHKKACHVHFSTSGHGIATAWLFNNNTLHC